MGAANVLTATATTAASGGTCSARVGDVTVTVRVAVGLAVAAGDTILVTRQAAHWWAIARLFTGTAEQPNDGAPPPKPAQIDGRLTVAPMSTGTYRAGWRTDVAGDTLQGASPGVPGNNTGAAFYGTAPRSLTGATVTAASVRLRRRPGGSAGPSSVTLWLVTQATQPVGAPTLTLSTPGPSLELGLAVDVAVPAAWVQAMVDGTAGGLAVFDGSGAPYVRLAGLNTYAPAWVLNIDWTRIT